MNYWYGLKWILGVELLEQPTAVLCRKIVTGVMQLRVAAQGPLPAVITYFETWLSL